jgi:D-glycero-D-manno-heptose 1,7-bisphosphate phosphatase
LKKAIFLDRDGTLNYSLKKKNSNKVRPPYKISELKFYEDLHELKKYSKEYLLIVVTNQPDIRRGKQKYYFNRYINNELKKIIPIKKIYTCYCLEKESNCNCYKPKPEMIFKAQKKYQIDLKKSYMIGDTWRDIGLGNNSGCISILIDRKYDKSLTKLNQYRPKFIINKFFELKKIIKS